MGFSNPHEHSNTLSVVFWGSVSLSVSACRSELSHQTDCAKPRGQMGSALQLSRAALVSAQIPEPERSVDNIVVTRNSAESRAASSVARKMFVRHVGEWLIERKTAGQKQSLTQKVVTISFPSRLPLTFFMPHDNLSLLTPSSGWLLLEKSRMGKIWGSGRYRS